VVSIRVEAKVRNGVLDLSDEKRQDKKPKHNSVLTGKSNYRTRGNRKEREGREGRERKVKNAKSKVSRGEGRSGLWKRILENSVCAI
jgi:hypothetical protein